MEVIIRDTHDAATDLAARLISDAITAQPRFTLGLATGRTMESLYGRLARMHRDGAVSFGQVTTFNLDEYIGLCPDDPNSYHYYMREHLFRHINIDPANTHLPDGAHPDPDAASAHYEEMIAAAGGIDLQLLGIGRSGHIGFNEPLSALRSRTRPKALSPETIAQNAPLFDDPAKMPLRALTMGVGTILDSRRCLLVATGEEKAAIIARAVEGPITAMISASALQWHPKCTVIVDEPAAVNLTQQEYYRWIFANEPEWEPYR